MAIFPFREGVKPGRTKNAGWGAQSLTWGEKHPAWDKKRLLETVFHTGHLRQLNYAQQSAGGTLRFHLAKSKSRESCGGKNRGRKNAGWRFTL